MIPGTQAPAIFIVPPSSPLYGPEWLLISSHRIYILPRGKEEAAKNAPPLFKDFSQKLHMVLYLTSSWPKQRHMAVLTSRGQEVWSLFWVSMCPAISGGSNTEGKGGNGHGHGEPPAMPAIPGNLAARVSVLKLRLDHFTSLVKTILSSYCSYDKG